MSATSILKYLFKVGGTRISRFLIVGTFNTLFGYSVYLAFLYIGFPYWAAWGLALVVALMVGFVLSGSVVFGVLRAGDFIRYVGAWAGIYGLNVITLRFLLGLGVDARISPVLVLPLNIALSFFLQKTVVFNVRER